MKLAQSAKILVVGPAWVGDMVMAQCLFKLLKQRDPAIVIDVLAPAWTWSLLNRMPEVSQAIAMPFQHGELNLRGRYQLAKNCRRSNYTQAIVLPNSLKSALIPWAAHIPKRTGWLGEFRYGLLNDWRKLDKKQYPLMIEQFMALGLPNGEPLPQVYPYPAFTINPADQALVLHQFGLSQHGKPILALCPGAEFGPSKRWPAAHYAAVARAMHARGWAIWLFGSPKDIAIADEIMALSLDVCVNFTGQTSLAESIDLLATVTGVVSNDSGLMHIAAALQKPLVAIYGSTSPTFTPPLAKNANILNLDLDCQPCFQRECPLKHHRCMQALSPDQVLTAINRWEI